MVDLEVIAKHAYAGHLVARRRWLELHPRQQLTDLGPDSVRLRVRVSARASGHAQLLARADALLVFPPQHYLVRTLELRRG